MTHRDHHHDDDNLDRGLAFDVATVLSRRRMLSVLGLGALGLVGCSTGSTTATSGTTTSTTGASGSTTTAAAATCGDIPEETAGPYPGDGSNGPNVLAESGIVRSDIRSSFGSSTTTAEGVPLTINLTILDTASSCGPLAGAAVYLWHCNRDGAYSLYSQGITSENYLRGVQETDANGQVTFTSIFPAAYSGRWPHIHFEVYPSVTAATSAGTLLATSQVALPEATCEEVYATDGYSQSVRNLEQSTLESDNVFGDDGGVRQLATVTGNLTGGYSAQLSVPV